MIKCQICNKKCYNIHGLSQHLTWAHKDISKQQYYDQYILKFEKEKFCPICGKEKKCCGLNGYVYITCGNRECIKYIYKQTNLKKYGVENPYQSKEVKYKIKQTNLKKYGVENYTKTEEYKERVKSICLKKYNVEHFLSSDKIKKKIKQTLLKNYGVDHNWKSNIIKYEIKKTNLKKYGVENPFQAKEIIQKIWKNKEKKLKKEYQTKKKNNSFNTSKPEKELLKEIKKFYPDIKYQYNSSSYPFSCDFYIPSKDLYIELNLHWTHGKEPFDIFNKEHLDNIKFWVNKSKNSKFYKNAIYTWTDLDVRKREIAQKNNLNYLEFYNYDTEKILDEIDTFI